MELYTEDQLKIEIDKLLENKNNTIKDDKLKNMKDKKVLVISGGSLKGISALGALKALEDLKCLTSIEEYAGTSIGAIISLLLCINYNIDEIYNFVLLLDFSKIQKIEMTSILTRYGMDSGEKIEKIIEKLLCNKNFAKTVTFLELYNQTKKTLTLTATCVNDKEVKYLSHKTTPNLSVLKAVRMSISIPIYFVPVEHEGKYYIDGGCIDNYPINIYKNRLNDVIGIYLASKKESKNITNVESYMSNMISSLFQGVTSNSIKSFEDYTFKIECENKSIINMDIDNKKKQILFTNGYNTVIDKLSI